ncbi:MAG: tRNA pseudouridine(38-40) synthase TruA [Spirochaetaceae bacterium]|jgi:tRNA pseudouridine38-40 synthase|nr:tRNA pseudouridine(38-40) synthase TruA [Spirochaetaceae bacterium]
MKTGIPEVWPPEGSRNIRILVAYDGTDFSGWQRQAGRRTVQGTLESALEGLHKRPVPCIGSGRTDAGVHAAGQVVHFHTPLRSIPVERFVPALNRLLPRDIRLLAAEEARFDFHARFDARSRTYRYFLICGRPALPQELRYACQLWRHPQLERLNSYARLFRGELDCSVFTHARDPSLSRSRYLFGACFFIQGDMLVFEITANAFLWKMIRSVLGTLLYYEEQGLPAEDFKAIIHSGDRSRAGPTLAPQGLFLWHITYYPGKRDHQRYFKPASL